MLKCRCFLCASKILLIPYIHLTLLQHIEFCAFGITIILKEIKGKTNLIHAYEYKKWSLKNFQVKKATSSSSTLQVK